MFIYSNFVHMSRYRIMLHCIHKWEGSVSVVYNSNGIWTIGKYDLLMEWLAKQVYVNILHNGIKWLRIDEVDWKYNLCHNSNNSEREINPLFSITVQTSWLRTRSPHKRILWSFSNIAVNKTLPSSYCSICKSSLASINKWQETEWQYFG